MLTDLQCRDAKGQAKSYKLSDGHGLYLLVTPTGYRSWRMKYRVERKEKLLTFGPYPDVKLKEARLSCEAAGRVLRDGIDPGAPPPVPVSNGALMFERIARHRHRRYLASWKMPPGKSEVGKVD